MQNTVTRIILGVVTCLVTLGIIILASTSSVKGIDEQADAFYFLKRQAMWLAIGLIAGIAASKFDYHNFRGRHVPLTIAGITIFLLLLVWAPGIGAEIKGSNRWLKLGPFTLQPSEIAKLVTILCLAHYIVKTGWRMDSFKYGVFRPLIGLGMILGPILAEPDFGTTVLIGMVSICVLYVGGMPGKYMVGAFFAFAFLIIALALVDPVRSERIFAFLNPEKYPEKSYQLTQAKVAFIRGEWDGVGLGQSMQKQFYLPEAYTDFILPIVGEELGLIASGGVVVAFAIFMFCGIFVSYSAPDLYGRLIALGITVWISGQAIINIAVVTGCAPTKGLPLPFISYGGSNLVMALVAVGVLMNVAKHCTEGSDKHTLIIKDDVHEF